MSDNSDFTLKRFPWLRSGFDLEGYVGALAAWLVGLLLGALWSPLFWIGFIGAIVILFATRTAERTPPKSTDVLVTPVDGIVVDVARAIPPAELRLAGGDWTRVRISVGPTKTNGIYAPIDGELDHIILENGDPAAFAAMSVDRPGLAVAYVSLESGERATGMRLATGGLGPRLEVRAEAGDAVRLGRNIGTMRLGGWCEVYVPADVEIDVIEGQTLIGSETVLARFEERVSRTVFTPRDEPAAEETFATPVLTPAAVVADVTETVVTEADDVVETVEATVQETAQEIGAVVEDTVTETVETTAETVSDTADDIFDDVEEVVTAEFEADTETAYFVDDDAATPSEDALTLEKIAGRVAAADAAVEPETDDESVADMLARLRSEARKAYKDD